MYEYSIALFDRGFCYVVRRRKALALACNSLSGYMLMSKGSTNNLCCIISFVVVF